MKFSEPVVSFEKIKSVDFIASSVENTEKTVHVDPDGSIWTPRY